MNNKKLTDITGIVKPPELDAAHARGQEAARQVQNSIQPDPIDELREAMTAAADTAKVIGDAVLQLGKKVNWLVDRVGAILEAELPDCVDEIRSEVSALQGRGSKVQNRMRQMHRKSGLLE